jgi:putative acetyltransferase
LITIVREREEHHAGIRALVTAAMGPPEAELVERVRTSEQFVPGLALVAVRHETPLGYALFSRVGLVGETGWTVLALAPLCVRREWRRGGIGTRLVTTGLEHADELGEPLVTVLGDPAYYGRFGFEPASRFGIEPPAGMPVEAYSARPLSAYRPDMRGRVVYPPAFDGV